MVRVVGWVARARGGHSGLDEIISGWGNREGFSEVTFACVVEAN